MRGVYVDQHGCLVLVLMVGECNKVSRYTVHGTTTTSPDDEWIATCELSSDTVTLTTEEDRADVGTRQDNGNVEWKGGDTWRPLHMSSTQFAFFTHRPYVPMMYVFLMVLNNLFSRVKALVKTK